MNGKPKSKLDVGTAQKASEVPKGTTRRLSMKIAKIRNVYPDKNTFDLEWLWPIRGGADKVSIGRPYIGFRSGMHFVPEIGSIIVVGYAHNQMVVLSYLMPSDYENLKTNLKDSEGNPSRIRQMGIGEMSFNSIQNSEIYLHEKVEIRDKTLDSIIIDPTDGSIALNSLAFYADNEAGSIEMGMVSRTVDGKTKIITDDGKDISTVNGGNALTEFKIKINEFADGSLIGGTSNKVLAEVTLGTLVNSAGKQVLNQAGNEIVCNIQLDSGTLVQIDKKGNVNINNGNMLKPLEFRKAADDLSQASDVSFGLFNSQQRAAREGDRVVIPLSIPAKPAIEHPGLLKKSVKNMLNMQSVVKKIMTPMGPCLAYIPLGINDRLVGEITQGSDSVFIGSKDKDKESEETGDNDL